MNDYILFGFLILLCLAGAIPVTYFINRKFFQKMTKNVKLTLTILTFIFSFIFIGGCLILAMLITFGR